MATFGLEFNQGPQPNPFALSPGDYGYTPPASSAPATSASSFNLNPAPQGGQGAFGAVPGPLGLPNPSADLAAQVPGLAGLNSTAASDIQSMLGGTLSPSTLNALKNASATFGVTSGMPGSGLSWNSLYGNIAGASEAQQQQGLQDYNSFVPTVSGTQTVSPALQNEIANQNSLNAAAPNPTAAASYAEQLFNQYLSAMRGPAGGTQDSSGPDEMQQAYLNQYGPGSGFNINGSGGTSGQSATSSNSSGSSSGIPADLMQNYFMENAGPGSAPYDYSNIGSSDFSSGE